MEIKKRNTKWEIKKGKIFFFLLGDNNVVKNKKIKTQRGIIKADLNSGLTPTKLQHYTNSTIRKFARQNYVPPNLKTRIAMDFKDYMNKFC